MIATIEWHRTAEKPPESFLTVIAADGDGNTFAGYTNGEYWRDDCGDMVLAPEFWAHLPAGPVAEPVAEAVAKERGDGN